MSNPWSGLVAKSIAAKKRPRSFWNIFFSIAIVIILGVTCVFVYQVASDHLKYESEQVFIEYKNGILTTNASSFEICKNDKQEVQINKLILYANAGDKITLTISKISGELIEIKHLNKTVYKKSSTPIIPSVIAYAVLVLPLLVFLIFMLVVTNLKSPGKRIAKIQNQFLLKFYK